MAALKNFDCVLKRYSFLKIKELGTCPAKNVQKETNIPTTINLFQQVKVNNVHFTPKHELWILNDIFLNQIYNNVNNYFNFNEQNTS